jgi:hypothetical protein
VGESAKAFNHRAGSNALRVSMFKKRLHTALPIFRAHILLEVKYSVQVAPRIIGV